MDGIRDVRMLLENSVSVMTVNNQPVPDDDRIDNLAIIDDVFLKLFQLLKSEWWNLALKLRVNFKRSQFHHRTVLS